MKRNNMMSKKMRVFSMIVLGVLVCFLSFTTVFYSSIKEMRANANVTRYAFANEEILNDNYEKFGTEMGFESASEYERAASAVIRNPNSLFKVERKDGDGLYYRESTNEFVILSADGYIKAYYNPEEGKDYFDRL